MQQQNNVEVLQQLSEAVSDKRKTKGQLHKVFEDSFDAKSIETDKFFYQKIGVYTCESCKRKLQIS